MVALVVPRTVPLPPPPLTPAAAWLRRYAARQPDNSHFRLWEVAGTAHADAHQMGGLAANRQVGVLLNRKGQVEYVMVGTAKQIEMPDFGRARVSEDRFRGLRCVHTHLLGESLTQDDLTDLALLRLDLMSIIQVEKKAGLPGMVYSAHLLPMAGEPVTDDLSIDGDGIAEGAAYSFLEPNIPAHLDTDFGALISSLEDEMARIRLTARTKQTGRDRAILVGVTTGDVDEALVARATAVPGVRTAGPACGWR